MLTPAAESGRSRGSIWTGEPGPGEVRRCHRGRNHRASAVIGATGEARVAGAALFIAWRRPHGEPCRNQDAHRGLALEEEIPPGFAPDGLPVGVQIIGRRTGATPIAGRSRTGNGSRYRRM